MSEPRGSSDPSWTNAPPEGPRRGWKTVARLFGVVVLGVAVALATSIAVARIDQRRTRAVALEQQRAAAEAAAQTPEPPPTRSPGATPTPAETPSPSPATSPTPTPRATPAPPPEETTVQVLDGVYNRDAFAAAVEALIQKGYDVVHTERAIRQYEETTVFYTSGHRVAAETLARGDERFTVSNDNPGLTESIELHVVVGTDWSG